ncbi:MAG: SCO family protein [Woeseia sp.]
MIALTTSGLVVGCQKAPEPAAEIDISFELIDESGRTVTSRDYEGQVRLVFFGYTSCPDICPITLHNIATALRSLGPLATQVNVLFISVDPKRDTPEILARYTDAFHPAVIGLTGTYDQIVDVTMGFRTTFGYSTSSDGVDKSLSKEEYQASSPNASYVPFHSSQIYMIGRANELLDIIGYGSKPTYIAAKLRDYIDD